MKRLFKNANILDFSCNNPIIKKTDILISDNTIINIGNINPSHDAIVQDMSCKLILPSLFNMHCHLGENIFADICGNDWNLMKYLDYTENINKRYTISEVNKIWNISAFESIQENLRNGVFGFCAARSAEPATKCSIDTMAGYPIMQSKKLKHFTDMGIKGFIDYFDSWNTDRCSVGVFLHSLYTNNITTLKMVSEMMQRAEFLTIHISEDEITRKKEIDLFSKLPIQVLKDYGILNHKTILVHGGFLSDDELDMIAESRAAIVVCPISNKFLNTKLPDINKLKKWSIPWCIATDGLGTGRTFSMFRQAIYLKECFPDLTYLELFRAMTEVPALFYPRDHYSGRIENGKNAHWIVIDKIGNDAESIIRDLIRGIIKYSVIIGGEEYVYNT